MIVNKTEVQVNKNEIPKKSQNVIKSDPESLKKYEKYRKEQKKSKNSQFGKLPMNFLTYWIAFIKNIICKKKLSPTEKIIIKSEQLFTNDIDIITIASKLQEVERLKMLFLTPEQISMFNLSSKPLIYVNEEGKTIKTNIQEFSDSYDLSRQMEKEKKGEELIKMVSDYKSLKENKSELTDKIMNMLSVEFKDFCDNFDKIV